MGDPSFPVLRRLIGHRTERPCPDAPFRKPHLREDGRSDPRTPRTQGVPRVRWAVLAEASRTPMTVRATEPWHRADSDRSGDGPC
jgi:hypothetical protein